MPSDINDAARMAAIAGLSGGLARVLMALHGGVRAWQALLIEAGLGGALGVMAAAAAVYFDPGLRDAGWPLLIVSGASGAAGALGTRLLDVLVAAARRRLGGL